MDFITLEDAKTYLRVDSSADDALINTLIASAEHFCVDVARLTSAQWADIKAGNQSSEYYRPEEIKEMHNLMHIAILYTIAYLYEHREEADHQALSLTIRAVVCPFREEEF